MNSTDVPSKKQATAGRAVRPTATLDGKGRVTAVNQVWYQSLGVYESSLTACSVGTNFLDAARAAGDEAFVRSVSEILRGHFQGTDVGVRCRKREDGRECAIILAVEALLPANGAIVTYTDVTEDHRGATEQELEKGRIDALLRHAIDLVLIHDPIGTITLVSPSITSRLGWTQDEVLGKDGFFLLHPDDVDVARGVLADISTEPFRTQRIEMRMRHRDGSWRWLDAQVANLIDDPHIGGVLVVSRDVTEAKVAAKATQAREQTLRLALEAGRMAVWDWDITTNRITWSGTEHLPSDVLVSSAFDVDFTIAASALHPDDGTRIYHAVDLATSDAPQYEVDFRWRRSDGSVHWLHDRGLAVEFTPEGRAARIVGVTMDVNEFKRAQKALEEQAESFSTLFNGTAEPMVIHDGRHIVVANQAAVTLVGYDHETAIGRDLLDLVAPESIDFVRERFRQQLEVPYEIDALHADGTFIPIEVLSRGIRYNGRDLRLLTLRDIRERRRAEEALRAREARFRALIQDASDLVVVFDHEGRLAYANPALVRVLGHPMAEFSERFRVDLVHPDDRPSILASWERVIATPNERIRVAYRAQAASGAWVWLEGGLTNLLEHPEVNDIVVNVRDVTEQKRFEAELHRRALHDPLTGTPNRMLLADRLHQALIHAQQQGGAVAILFFNLDNFKHVNDAYGHAAGDALLQDVTKRLGAALEPTATLARIGGDEFVVLLPSIEHEREATDVADQLHRVMRSPFRWHGHDISIRMSIGISTSLQGLNEAESLLQAGDQALYGAKRAGRNVTVAFTEHVAGDAGRRLGLQADLVRAVDQGELALHYQPIFNLATGDLDSLEALLRWVHPKFGIVAPDEFIPLAEEGGLIGRLDRWVLGEVCDQLCRWGKTAPPIAVNLSAGQFGSPDLVTNITTLLTDQGLPPDRLHLEITEHMLVSDVGRACQTLAHLRRLGVKVDIDDFGNGYSSLRYLRRLPVDGIKLDRTFINGLESDPGAVTLVKSVTTLAHSIGLTVTAEGIETPEQLAHLRELGCNRGQGFLLARPTQAQNEAYDVARMFPLRHLV